MNSVLSKWVAVERVGAPHPFTSEDLVLAPRVAQRFARSNSMWNENVLKRVRQFSSTLELFKGGANLDRGELLVYLSEIDAEFQAVERRLATYLETKRSRFARFYFLSNDELIAPCTSYVRSMSGHISKCLKA